MRWISLLREIDMSKDQLMDYRINLPAVGEVGLSLRMCDVDVGCPHTLIYDGHLMYSQVLGGSDTTSLRPSAPPEVHAV